MKSSYGSTRAKKSGKSRKRLPVNTPRIDINDISDVQDDEVNREMATINDTTLINKMQALLRTARGLDSDLERPQIEKIFDETM